MPAMTAPMPDHLPAPSEDAALLRRWVEHADRDALGGALRPHFDAGWRVARRLTGSASEAEDALQDACLLAMREARRFRGEGSVRAWFLAIVANAARMRVRAAARRERHLPPPPPAGPPHDEDPDGLREAALAAVGRLPEHERLPLWLHAVEGLTCADIAAALRRREGTVRSQVSRALDRLRGTLGARGAALGAGALMAALAGGAAEAAPMPAVAKAIGTLATAAVPSAALAVPLSALIAVVAALLAGVGAWIGHHSRAHPSPPPATVEPPPPPLLAATPAARIIGAGRFVVTGDIERAALSPDGATLALGVAKGKVELWDVATATRTVTLDLPPERAVDVLFTPDGSRLIAIVDESSGRADEVVVWDARSSAKLADFRIDYVQYGDAAISADGRTLVIAGGDTQAFLADGVRAWDLATGKRLAHADGVARRTEHSRYTFDAVALSRDGRRVACLESWHGSDSLAAVDQTLRIVQLAWPSGERLEQWPLPGIDGSLGHLAYTSDGSALLLSGVSRARKPASLLLDAHSGAVLREWPGFAMLLSGDRVAVVAEAAAWISTLDGSRVGEPMTLVNAPRFANHASLSADGALLAVDGSESTPLLLDLRRRLQLAPDAGAIAKRASLPIYLPDGRLGVYDLKRVRLYGADDGLAAGSIVASWWTTPAFSGRLMLAASPDDQQPWLIDLATGTTLARLPAHQYLQSDWLSADGRFALTEGQYDRPLRLHDLARGSVRATLPRPDSETFHAPESNLTGVRWSRDGKRIFVADQGAMFSRSAPRPHGFTGIRDAMTLERLVTLVGDDGVPVDCANDLDLAEEADLLTLRTDRGVGLWRASDGAFIRRLREPARGTDEIANGVVPGMPLRFNHDATLLVGGDRVAVVADGSILRRFPGAPVRLVSPTGTLHAAIQDDGYVVVREVRDGGALLRRAWHVPGSGAKPECLAWRPDERGIAIGFSDSPVVMELDLVGAAGPEAPIADLDADDLDRRTAAIDALARGGAEALAALRARLAWPQATATPGTRAAIQALDALAGRGIDSAQAHLQAGAAAPDATVARWCGDALARVQAALAAAGLRRELDHPAPFSWPARAETAPPSGF